VRGAITMEDSDNTQVHPYRLGYKEGFRDGYGEAERHVEKQSGSQKESAGGADGKGNGDDKGHGDDNGQGGDKNQQSARGKTPLYKRPGVVAIVLAVVLALIIAAIVFWRHSRRHESTDDAFIDGITSQVAAQTSGRVIKLYITDNQWVNAGDALLDIDSRDNDARISQSRAQLATAQGQYDQSQSQIATATANAGQADAAVRESEADLKKAAEDLAKYRAVDPEAVPKQMVDSALSTEQAARAKVDASRMSARAAHAQVQSAIASTKAAQAQIQAAQATLDASDLQGSYTHVTAPIAGRVTRRSVDVGNVIATGQALLALVSKSLWVTANYKETQLTRMRPGQPVKIVVDAYPSVKFRGRVDSIQRATGAYFSTLPAENATGNYVKVVQRVPVKIVFDDDGIQNYAIGPGMSVTPDVSLP
jgi:membrane fusion protein (multidrug efflux system)